MVGARHRCRRSTRPLSNLSTGCKGRGGVTHTPDPFSDPLRPLSLPLQCPSHPCSHHRQPPPQTGPFQPRTGSTFPPLLLPAIGTPVVAWHLGCCLPNRCHPPSPLAKKQTTPAPSQPKTLIRLLDPPRGELGRSGRNKAPTTCDPKSGLGPDGGSGVCVGLGAVIGRGQEVRERMQW